jgi:hypothetical protein
MGTENIFFSYLRRDGGMALVMVVVVGWGFAVGEGRWREREGGLRAFLPLQQPNKTKAK